MKLASLKNGTRDGSLHVVSRDLTKCAPARSIAPTMQAALDDWDEVAPRLRDLYEKLNHGSAADSAPFDPSRAMAPLPRAYQWADGSVYVSHATLMQKAFDKENNRPFLSEPMMYQGGSDDMLGGHDDIEANSEADGIDFEGELAIVTSDVPAGVSKADAGQHIRLVMLVNDVSLRNLIMHELDKGFGFFHSKPSTAFAPVAVTPDELGDAWRGDLVHLPLEIDWNGQRFGNPNTGVGAGFNFSELIAFAAHTRRLGAGTIVGSGTVSNDDPSVGSACIAERRAMERIRDGQFSTPYMSFGDRVRLEVKDAFGQSVFGAIDQRVVQRKPGVGRTMPQT